MKKSVILIQEIFDLAKSGETHRWYDETVCSIIMPKKGFVELYRVPCEEQTASIAIFVHPDYRRKGLGRYLMGFVMYWARKGGWNLEWYVRTDNVASRRLVESCGFSLAEEMSNAYMKTYVWEKG